MTYIIVGFKVSQENSIHYAKAHSFEQLFIQIQAAFNKGSDFISLRRVQ